MLPLLSQAPWASHPAQVFPKAAYDFIALRQLAELTVPQTPGPFSSSLPSRVTHTTRLPRTCPFGTWFVGPRHLLQKVWTVNNKIAILNHVLLSFHLLFFILSDLTCHYHVFRPSFLATDPGTTFSKGDGATSTAPLSSSWDRLKHPTGQFPSRIPSLGWNQ